VREDWRIFRLDRLTDPRATGSTFRPRKLPAADAARFVQASIAAVTARYHVDVLVFAPVENVAREVAQWGSVEAVSDEACRQRMRVTT
jgi:hypothetical protein